MRKASKTWCEIINEENYIIGAKVNGIETMINFDKYSLPEETDPVNFGLDFIQSQYPESVVEFDFLKIQ